MFNEITKIEQFISKRDILEIEKAIYNFILYLSYNFNFCTNVLLSQFMACVGCPETLFIVHEGEDKSIHCFVVLVSLHCKVGGTKYLFGAMNAVLAFTTGM